MPTRAACPVCALGESVCNEIARMTMVGLPASDIVTYLGGLGFRLTQRQLVDHRRHVISLQSPRLSIKPSNDVLNPEVCSTSRSSEAGLTDIEREDRLLMGLLSATDNMLESLERTGSIKISRAVVELASVANQILKERMARPVETNEVINIFINPINLEDRLTETYTDYSGDIL